ncbi:MAG: energy-coupling factor transporter transmembrane protein EcfT [Acetatifactor sp.]|nr:energy-coupling factor transporter transmembrane protein EcfT [Acetatifactor sp.]
MPDWMMQKNEYVPSKDREGFLTKSLLGFLRLFRHFSMRGNSDISVMAAGMGLILTLGLIILVALTDSLTYLACVGALVLAFLSFSKLEIMKRALGTSLSVMAFTFVIMLPSYFLYGSLSYIYIPVKVFLSVSMLSVYTSIVPWNRMTAALRLFGMPNILIFVLDMTIHYILILGNVAFDMLAALKLKSIGKNRDKVNSFSGISGTVFMKAVTMSKETEDALTCRLFDGKYDSKKERIVFADFIPLFILCIFIFLYIFVG